MEQREILILGAGNIGRGVIGSVFFQAGYRLTFYDASPALTRALGEQGWYTVERRGAQVDRVRVSGYGVLDGDEALTDALADARLAACCVYRGAFDALCRRIAQALPRRMERGAGPLDLLLCVNELGAVGHFREGIEARLQTQGERDYFARQVGLCQTLVLRAGMPGSPELRAQDPLSVITSRDENLYVDADAFHGSLDIGCIRFAGQMEARMRRKIYTGNMFHCIQALLGAAKGYADITACRADPRLMAEALAAYREAEEALAREYGFDEADRAQWNREVLGDLERPGGGTPDPVGRIVARPREKLGRDNRFVAPALLCLKNGILPFFLARGIACGLDYRSGDDPQSLEIGELVASQGIEAAIRTVCGLAPEDWVLAGLIHGQYQLLKQEQAAS